MFKLTTNLKPQGDQPGAIRKLTDGIKNGAKDQVLLGVTGSGKTFTVANVIQNIGRPTLVISHNKVLAAQLYQEFREFFPENAVHYFVSYYDYYQPEAYIPHSDTYIEKDAKINDLIDQLRHAATADVLSRPDTIVIASVSCIYGLGDPATYEDASLEIAAGQTISRNEFLKHLINLQYHRNDYDPVRGEFRGRGDTIEIYLPHGTEKITLSILNDKISDLYRIPLQFKARDPRSPKYKLDKIRIFPAKHFVTPQAKLKIALQNIATELDERLKILKDSGKLLEAERLEQRTRFDMEMLKEVGYCPGIENYSRHLSFRQPGEPPFTLIDYFNYSYGDKKWMLVIDESHMTVPQIRGMYNGDRARKEVLVDYGFRLPSAVDNRPLKFEEFKEKTGQTIYVSATPAAYELEKAGSKQKENGWELGPMVAEQIIRPTGILDPEVEVRPIENQVDDLISEIKKRVAKKERVLAVTLTKRLAEDLAEYLAGVGLKVHWLHSEVKTLARPEILKDLREGKVDVVIGINLLREGLDLPEVSLVAILDADKEGFLRNDTTLIQTMGRAARHTNGRVIMYADRMTDSMRRAMNEIARRRKIQEKWNKEHNIEPTPIIKPIRPSLVGEAQSTEQAINEIEAQTLKKVEASGGAPHAMKQIIAALESEMKIAAKEWDFERAAKIRDQIQKFKTKP